MGFTSVDTEIWISPFAVFLSDVSTRPDQTGRTRMLDGPSRNLGLQAAAHSTSPNWRVCRLGPQPWATRPPKGIGHSRAACRPLGGSYRRLTLPQTGQSDNLENPRAHEAG